MGVKYSMKKNLLPEMIKQCDALNGKAVEAGVLNGEHTWLAGIHEYGVDIRPGRAEYLTVPLCKEAAGRKAGSFKNTFIFEAKSGNKFIARKKGDDDFELLYWLTKHVKIPERAFLRKGYDECRDDAAKKASMMIADVSLGKMSVDEFLDAVGEHISSAIKDYAVDLKNPPNSPITSGNKGSSNPLAQTGDMIAGITWRKAKE